MANSTTVIKITHPENTQTIKDIGLGISNTASDQWMESFMNYLNALQGGVRNASIDCQVSGGVAAQATGTLTFTGAPTNNQTCLINGVTFTAVTSGATGNQFNIGGTVTISATNLAAAINASVTAFVTGVVTATSAAGVVTITAVTPGLVGNSLLLATSMTNTTVSGAKLTGGLNPVANTYAFGL